MLKVKMTSKEIENTEASEKHAVVSVLAELHLRKSRAKAFTRYRNKLCTLLIEEDTTNHELKCIIEHLEHSLDTAVSIIMSVADFYREHKRTLEMVKTLDEVDDINRSFDVAMKMYHSFRSAISSPKSVKKLKCTVIEKNT